MVGAWTSAGLTPPIGTQARLGGRNVATLVFQTGRAARIDDHASASGPITDAVRELGVRASVGVPVGQLVVGGAFTSVLVGIAAQQSMSNIFAGLVLLLSRPFRVGDAIRLRAGALGGQLDGVVTEIGITYIRLDTGESVMSVPNAQVLAAAVSPIPRKPEGPEPPAVVEPENPATRAWGRVPGSDWGPALSRRCALIR